MSIREAFEMLIENNELAERSGISKENRRYMRWKLKTPGQTVTEETMRQYLDKAGFKEKASWKAPKIKAQQ